MSTTSSPLSPSPGGLAGPDGGAVTNPLLKEATDVLAAYARTHAVEVWIWERQAEGWQVVVGTTAPRHDAPGPAAAAIPNAPEREWMIEIEGGAEPQGAATFLSSILAQLLQHQIETRFMGREIAERYEEITLLYTISEVLGSVISLDEAATTILREVVDTMAVQHAALWLFEPELKSLVLVASVGDHAQIEPIAVADPTSITAAVFRDRRPAILDAGEVFPRPDSGRPTNRNSFLSVPVSYTPPHGETRTIGVINLIGRTVEEGFSAGDHKLISAIASQIGAAIENSRLVAESLRRERIEREMELAHHLQLKLLPSAERFRDRAQVAARCVPAESVGGDFYHLVPLPGNRLGVVIGDVSSHGFGAALIMALTMSAVAIHASEGDPPAQVLRRVHQTLIEELENTEMYLTLFYGVIDPAAGTLCYANAGHSHAFHISAEGEPQRLATTNPPFGLVDLDAYGENMRPWSPGRDLLFLFTDGLSDALVGGERILVDRVAQDRDLLLDDLLASLFALDGDAGDRPSDDRTALLVRV